MVSGLIAVGVDLGIGMAGMVATTALGYFALRLVVEGMARKLK